MGYDRQRFRPAEPDSTGHLGQYSRGYLPHVDKPNLTQFLTIRLADSIPGKVLAEWRIELARLSDVERQREEFKRAQAYLNLGRGSCVLRRPDVARIVEESLLHRHGGTFRLIAWSLMPNHLHLLAELPEGTTLPKLMQSYKKFTAREANKILNRRGSFWFRDYYDRWMRNDDHLSKTITYIEANPVKAGLCESPSDYSWSSARFRDADGGLQIPGELQVLADLAIGGPS